MAKCTATFKLKMFLVSCSINISRFFVPKLKTQAVPGGVKGAMSAFFNMGVEAKITIFRVRELARKIPRNQYRHLQALIKEQSICSPMTFVSITCGENSGGTWGVEKNPFYYGSNTKVPGSNLTATNQYTVYRKGQALFSERILCFVTEFAAINAKSKLFFINSAFSPIKNRQAIDFPASFQPMG